LAPIIVTVGSGKGGVGKTTLAANLGALLASRGKRVCLVDADLGGANLHHFVGIRAPKVGLQDFLQGNLNSLADVALETSTPNLYLVGGAGDIVELANPKFTQKGKILRGIEKLNCHYVLVDLGAGSGNNVVDFFAAFQNGIVVCDSLPTSIENAYAFLKNGIIRGVHHLFAGQRDIRRQLRRLSNSRGARGCATMKEFLREFTREYPREAGLIRTWLRERRIALAVTMVKNRGDVAVGNRFVEIIDKYLSVRPTYIGYVIDSPYVRSAVRASCPAALMPEAGELRTCFNSLADNLLALTEERTYDGNTGTLGTGRTSVRGAV